ncbi:DUF6924 domain-containing protein [Streptomyces clavifer]|uniref:DUF6924 domain-containing protein n=1 Tax=Streptomyces clavifer TaxID=68188 RepID=UPI002E823BD4|nr:hypothetical protein [Streptomyces clavifer]WRY80036.1 hypothetical protein OG388_01745 [Streptomyces clavifer]WRY86282.1 hypothetical protein OG388_36250 [Streptomyces clavifer]WUC32341.1 hypothetical protein OG927_33685 [Streptomyces clavifer]
MLPEVVGRDEFAALIIRTDYNDETAWQTVTADLRQPWGDDGEFEADVHLVEDPVWADATSDEVLAAVSRDENLSVVFIADRVTMQSAHRALLALDVGVEVEDLDPEYYQELISSPSRREFRTVPVGVHCVHANLSLANMDFEEYAETAIADPEGVFRSF